MMNWVRKWHAILLTCLSVWLLGGPPAHATYSSFFSFNGSNGATPTGALTPGSDGLLYGVTSGGGDNGSGTIFKISTTGTISVLHSFAPMASDGTSTNADGLIPNAPLVQGADGNFYGTTQIGGANGAGTVFRITPGGTLTTLYAFQALDPSSHNAGGAYPATPLVVGPDGALYGTTPQGGANQAGTIFRIAADGSFTTLYQFTGQLDGRPTPAPLVNGGSVLYGVSQGAQNAAGYLYNGVLYSITPGGVFTSLYGISGYQAPSGLFNSLFLGSDGLLYGQTTQGGAHGEGLIYKFNPSSAALTDFFDGYYDALPLNSAGLAGDGNYYGTYWGYYSRSYTGAITQITPAGASSIIHSFTSALDGADPASPVVLGADGNLYGTTAGGGVNGDGTIYRIYVNPAPAPVLSALSPAMATVGDSSALITITGQNLFDTTKIYWNGAKISTTYKTDGLLTALVPYADLQTAGTASITAVTPAPGGGTSNALTFTVNPNLVPTTTSLSPSSVLSGSPDLTLAVNGTNFNDRSIVSWNNTALTTTYVSPTQVTAVVPASDLASGASIPVGVVNPYPGGGTSNMVTFTVSQPYLPVLASISPASVPAGSPDTTVTLTGSNFQADSVAEITGNGGVEPLATTFVSSTQLSAVVPASDLASTAYLTILVSTPDNGGGASAGQSFTVTNPVPVITSLNPASVQAGGPAFTLTINGTGFVSSAATGPYGNSTVLWNGQSLASYQPTVTITPTQITVSNIPASLIASVGSATITVQNMSPGGGTSNAVTLPIVTPSLSLTSISPAQSYPQDQDLTVTLTGTAFTSGMVAQWNGDTDLATTYVSSTQLTAVIPANLLENTAAGAYPITVTDPSSGNVSNAQTFTLLQAPTPQLTSLSPNSALTGGPDLTVTITGTGFIPTSQVFIASGSDASSGGVSRVTTYVSPTQLTVTLLSADLTTAKTMNLFALNPGMGYLASNVLPFTVNQGPNAVPTITGLNPTGQYIQSSDFWIEVQGTGFVPGSQVYWNGTLLSGFFVSLTQVNADVPASLASVPGPATITVVNPAPGGGTSNTQTFQLYSHPPTASSLSPSSATVGSGAFTLTVTGSGFISGASVLWNGTALPTTLVSGTQVTAAVPASDLAVAGTAAVIVQNPNQFTNPYNPLSFTINNPVPTLTSLNTASVTAGGPTFSLFVSGTNFVSGSKVYWNSTLLATTYVSATQLKATVPASLYASPTTASITVVNASPGGGTSNALSLSVVAPDTTPPTTTISLSGTAGGSGWYTSAVQATLSASDSGSGVSATYYTVDGGAQQTYSAPFTVSGDGSHTVTYWSVDAAGNTETAHSQSIRIDRTAPVTTGSVSGATVTLSATDSASGVAATYYTLDGGAQQTYSSSFTVTGSGAHLVAYWSVDAAGNVEASHSLSVTIDTTPPVTTASLSGTAGNSGWYTSAVQVTLSATDDLSGVAATYYTVDGGAQQTYSTAFTVSGDAYHTITFWSVDGAGNKETAKTQTIKVDTTAPVTTESVSGVIVSLAVTDATSGPKTVHYSIDGAASQTAASIGIDLSSYSDGNHTVTFWSEDVAGNLETQRTVTVHVDKTAPVTTASYSGTLGKNGWYVTPVQVTLTATDDYSGVASTFYFLNSGNWNPYAAPFTITDGSNSLSYYSQDKAGNRETVKGTIVYVDTVAPVTTAVVQSSLATLSATDAGSGVDSIYYTIDGGATGQLSGNWGQVNLYSSYAEGTHTLVYWAVDKAGNTESAHTVSVVVDKTPPTTTVSLSGPAGLNGWYTGPVQVTLSATDALSGILRTEYLINTGSSFTAYTGPVTVSAQGSNTFTYRSIDTAGNYEAAKYVTINIDATAPVTTASVSGSQVTLSATDGASGVSHTYYTIDGGAQQTYSAAFTVPSGSHAVAYWSVDAAGNVETSHSLAVTVDTTPPVTTATLSGTAGSNGWYTSSVQVTLSATDNASGVSATYYTIDGGSQQTYSAAFAVSGDGTHTVKYWSVDGVGNSETAGTKTVKIDATKPSLTFGSATTSPNAAGWYNAAVSVPYTASDATSGVASATPGSPLSISTEGSAVTGSVTVTDTAGNAATFTSPAFKIDRTAPVTTGSASGATVTLSATDSLSGVAHTYYTVDSGAQQTYSSAFTVTGSGSHTVKYWSVDNAGNTETSHTLTVSSGNVTVTPSVASGSSNSWSEEDLKFTSTQTITALSITITVQRSPGAAVYSGEYTNFPGGSVTMSNTTTANTVVYTYTLKSGKTLSANTAYTAAAQFSLNGTAHPYGSDTYSMTVTAGGVSQSYSGAM